MPKDNISKAQFAASACFIAKAAAAWAGDLAGNLASGLDQPHETARVEAIQRFRAEITGLLNVISTPH
jgi:hypothetical protein